MDVRRGSLVALVLMAASMVSCARGEQRREERSPAVTVIPSTPPKPSKEPGPSAGHSSSTVALSVIGVRVALVADEDDAVLRVIDLPRSKEVERFPLAGRPSELIVGDAAQGGRVYVAIRDKHLVQILAPSCEGKAPCQPTFREIDRLATAEEPVSMALGPKDELLVVVSGWGRELAGYSVPLRTRLFGVRLAREPRGVVLSADGRRAYVAHAVGSRVSTVTLDGEHRVDEVLLRGEDNAVGSAGFGLGTAGPSTKHERFAVQGFGAARLGDRVIVPVTLAYPKGDATKLVTSGYGDSMGFAPEEPALVLLDPSSPGWLRTRTDAVPLDKPRMRTPSLVLGGLGNEMQPTSTACLLPRAVVAHPKRSSVLVACLGLDQVLESYDSTAVLTSTRRGTWRVPAGPTGIAVDELTGDAVVWSQIDRTLTVLPLDDGKPDEVSSGTASVKVEPLSPRSETIELGRRVFFRPNGADGRSCASCHPDGRDDGLVWTSPGGPRQTPMLAGRLTGAAPYGWGGEATTLAVHLKETFSRLGAKPPTEKEMTALVAWISTMRPPAHEPKLSALEKRGLEVFNAPEVCCASCHLDGGHGTDGLKRNVGSGGTFDTPSLRFVSGTGPYFHDGRYPTLRELLVATDGSMGFTKHLPASDFDALLAYLGTL